MKAQLGKAYLSDGSNLEWAVKGISWFILGSGILLIISSLFAKKKVVFGIITAVVLGLVLLVKGWMIPAINQEQAASKIYELDRISSRRVVVHESSKTESRRQN